MSSMINSLLSFSRLSRKEITQSHINLKNSYKWYYKWFRPDIGKRNIKWDIHELPEINGDSNLLKMAFENLISNAIKYTSKIEHAVIEIGSNRISEYMLKYILRIMYWFWYAFADNLFGYFKECIIRRIMKDWYWPGKRKTDHWKHNGSVHAESKLGHGAVFYVTLPFVWWTRR